MKIILKNLKQIEYELQIESNSITVKDLKIEIEKLYSFDSEQIKLLFKGSVLDNSNLLSEYNITENSLIIMMNTKPKQFINNNMNNINNNINQNQNIAKLSKEETKQNISDILNDNLKIQIDSLVDMGFERSQVEIAVRAANGRIDLAVEYLNNGIPNNVNDNRRNNNNNRRNNIRSEIMNELKKQANIIKVLCKNDKYYIFTILNNIKRNDPGLLRLITDYRDEFEKLLDTPITEEDEQNYKNLEAKADDIISKRLEKNLKKLQEKAEKEKKEKEDKEKIKEDKKEENKDENKNIDNMEKIDIDKGSEEKNNEQELKNEETGNKKEGAELKDDKIEEDKEKKVMDVKGENIKMKIENGNIDKKDKVNDESINKVEQKNENINLNDNPNQIQNQLTEEDNQIINRLKNLGDFSYERVVEAYIVCNKNEDLTANYLFEQNN